MTLWDDKVAKIDSHTAAKLFKQDDTKSSLSLGFQGAEKEG